MGNVLDYVNWVEKVLHGTAKVWTSAPDNQRSVAGVSFEEVAEAMGFASKGETGRTTQPVRAVLDAMEELDRVGMLAQHTSSKRYFKFTQQGRFALQVGFSSG
jgi:hypothetical protein